MRLRTALTATALATTAAGAGPVVAQTPEGVDARLVPNTPRAASHLVVAAQDLTPPAAGRTPKRLVLAVQRGFKLDAAAVAERCTGAQADAQACPEGSRAGSGRAVVTASTPLLPGGAKDYTATLGFFLSAPRESGDLGGLVITVSEPETGTRATLTGRLVAVGDTDFAYEARFDVPADGAKGLPPGVSVALKRLDADFGAQRTTTRTVRVRRHGRVRRVKRRTVHALITNPATCGGTWRGRLRTTFADAPDDVRDLSVACRAG